MIELLGIGVERNGGGWLLHRVCAHWERPELVAVVSSSAAERGALLDALGGRVVPSEGRAWIDRVPLTAETAARIRARVAEVDLRLEPVPGRSLLWNTLADARPGLRMLHGLLRFPRLPERRAATSALRAVGLGERMLEPAAGLDRDGRLRLALARALTPEPSHLLIRDPDVVLEMEDAERLLHLAAALVDMERIGAAVSLRSLALARRFATRVAVLADGLLVLDAAPDAFSLDQVGWRRWATGGGDAGRSGEDGTAGERVQPIL